MSTPSSVLPLRYRTQPQGLDANTWRSIILEKTVSSKQEHEYGLYFMPTMIFFFLRGGITSVLNFSGSAGGVKTMPHLQ